MSNKIENGDYVKTDNNSLERVELIDDVAQSAKVLLRAKRGEFYPDKNFGSRLSTVEGENANAYALEYARQALYELDGVFVLKAEAQGDTIDFTLLINNEERQVSIDTDGNI